MYNAACLVIELYNKINNNNNSYLTLNDFYILRNIASPGGFNVCNISEWNKNVLTNLSNRRLSSISVDF